MDRLSIFDLGSLNENKRITAKFTKYEVDHRSDGTYICALLEEGQLPEWQEGYGAFSYSHSALDNVIKYINNQKAHHSKKSFKEEYIDFLKQFEVEYDEKYLFEWIDD